MSALQVEIWSDVACPWCYVGKRRLEAALARFEHAADVELRWRAFELDPHALRAVDPEIPYVDRLARKYRASRAHAQAMIDRMAGMGAEDGIEMRFDLIQPGNTFDAHRLIRLGLDRGRQDAVEERLFHAYLCEGAQLSDHEVLVRLGVEAGLAANEALDTLASDRFADAVRDDERLAHEREVTGVPFFVVGDLTIPGAQPVDTMLAVLRQAHARRVAVPAT